MALAPIHDASAVDWLRDSLVPRSGRVDQLVPRGFESYVRILHPALGIRVDQPKLRWAAIAERFGASLGPETHLEDIVSIEHLDDAPKALWDAPPLQGTLD